VEKTFSFAFALVLALLVLRKDLVITDVLHAHLDMKASTVKGRMNGKRIKRENERWARHEGEQCPLIL